TKKTCCKLTFCKLHLGTALVWFLKSWIGTVRRQFAVWYRQLLDELSRNQKRSKIDCRWLKKPQIEVRMAEHGRIDVAASPGRRFASPNLLVVRWSASRQRDPKLGSIGEGKIIRHDTDDGCILSIDL